MRAAPIQTASAAPPAQPVRVSPESGGKKSVCRDVRGSGAVLTAPAGRQATAADLRCSVLGDGETGRLEVFGGNGEEMEVKEKFGSQFQSVSNPFSLWINNAALLLLFRVCLCVCVCMHVSHTHTHTHTRAHTHSHTHGAFSGNVYSLTELKVERTFCGS